MPAERLEAHIDAIKLSLERDPLRYSSPFGGEESRRVIETRDYAGDGFALTAYVVLYQNFKAELKWIETTPLPHDEADE